MSRLISYFATTLWEIERYEHISKTKYCLNDEEDNKFIDCCIDGKVNYLITQDVHLQEVDIEQIKEEHLIEIKIMSPFQFSRELLRMKY